MTIGSSDDFGFVCPKCERLNRVNDDLIGKVIRCTGCNGSIVVEKQPEQALSHATAAVLPKKKGLTPGATSKRLSDERTPKLERQESQVMEDYAERDWIRPEPAPAEVLDGKADARPRLHLTMMVAVLIIVLIALVGFWGLAENSNKTVVAEEEKAALRVASLVPALPEPREVAENFLFAESLEERLKWVRAPDVHSDRIRAHFASIGPAEAEVDQLRPILQHQIDDRILATFGARFTSGRPRPLCVVEDENRRVVDWEAYARQGTASWEDLLAGRATSAEVRVFVQPQQIFRFGFGEDENQRYLGFAMTSPDCPNRLYGFVERPSRTASVMAKVYLDAMSKAGLKRPQRMTLKIESLDNSYSEQKFLIVRIVANSWVKNDGGDFEATCLVSSDGDMTELEKFENDVWRKMRDNARQQRGSELLVK